MARLSKFLYVSILLTSIIAPSYGACQSAGYYPSPDRVVERMEREEPRSVPIEVRNDARFAISKITGIDRSTYSLRADSNYIFTKQKARFVAHIMVTP